MFVRVVVKTVLFVCAVCLAGCTHPKKTEATAPAVASGAPTPPVIEDRDGRFDDQGSDGGKISGLSSVHFSYDSARLDTETKSALATGAKWILAHAKTHVQLEGHCDRHGSTEYNFALGERRAKAVRDFLVSHGVPTVQLSIISYGKEKLLDSAESEAADRINRRVNFKPAL